MIPVLCEQVCHLPFVGSEQCLDWLLRHNADVNAMASDGLMPIHLAAADGAVTTIQKLLRHGASPDSFAHNGLVVARYLVLGILTPFILPCEKYHAPSV